MSKINFSLLEYEQKLIKLKQKDKILILCSGSLYPYNTCIYDLFNNKNPLIYTMDNYEKVNADYKGNVYENKDMNYFTDNYFDIILIENCYADSNFDTLLTSISRILKKNGLIITPPYEEQLCIGMLFKYCDSELINKILKMKFWMSERNFFKFLKFETKNFNCLMKLFGFEYTNKTCSDKEYKDHFYIYKKINTFKYKHLIYSANIKTTQTNFYNQYINILPKLPDIIRFIKAQNEGIVGSPFEQVIKELKNGKKTSHWFWYIFPQIAGIIEFPSETTKLYSIHDKNEAIIYLNNPILRWRLNECHKLVYENLQKGKTIKDIFGSDDKKYISSLTLFYIVSKDKDLNDLLNSIIKISKLKLDKKTIELIQ